MTSLPSTDIASAPSEIARPKLDQPMGIKTILIFFAIMALGLFFAAYSIHKDLTAAGTPVTSYLPLLLLGVALLIALGFEFVNGFHDTANAVATVIYTHSLAPPIAVVFAMLIAAIIWNLGTWWLGLPASSSHTLIGSIIGVGVANALMRGRT